MIKDIKTIGNNVLRGKCHAVREFNDPKLFMRLRDMAETMYDANGIGLAAPQIGIKRRMVVVDVGEGLMEFINPEIISSSEETDETAEGCLSVPGRRGMVVRPKRIKLKAKDRYGEDFTLEADGLLARCIQHELDHLDGVLYVDKMTREIFDDEEETDEE
ncbi:MAG: peptide deformylase [Eubacteriales bacterium]|nr:peptide deformylase [Eubacteriales bacterium]